VEIHTTGNGHGVGLCQYGANGLAKLGRGYREILAYYYSGAGLQKLDTLE
jgi:stage II sporulation protein D